MKNNLLIAINIANAIMLVDINKGWHSLMMFVLIGEIPGTNVSLSPEYMILIFTTIACLVFLITIRKPIFKLSKHVRNSAKKLKLKRV